MRLPADELRKIAAEWRAARRIYAVYMELGLRAGLKLATCAELESPIDRAETQAIQQVHSWMDAAESQIAAHELRTYCQTNQVGEPVLRALIGRLMKKEPRQDTDRDKLDFLMVQYFTQCAPMKVQRDDVRPSEVATVLEILLGEVETGAPAWLEPLGKCIDQLRACKTLKELLEGKLLADGRKIKIGANGRYFTPAVLIAFTRYNFIARRTFFRLVRAELEALRADLVQLEKAGIVVVDCRAAKLGERESVDTLKSMVTTWKQPFRAEYAEGMSFERLVAVRQAAQSAIGTTTAKPVVKAVAAVASRIVSGSVSLRVEQPVRPVVRPAQNVTPAPKPAAPKQFSVEEEFRAIQAQLTEALLHGASAENTMTRITLGEQRLVLSSWEVRGFIEPNEEFSSAMQNGVAARVLVERELESAKTGGRREHMATLVNFAQTKAAMMQEHVAQARDARDIDAAVTLAATSKRLTQLLLEAQKFALEARQ
jgi:hypothetical protein